MKRYSSWLGSRKEEEEEEEEEERSFISFYYPLLSLPLIKGPPAHKCFMRDQKCETILMKNIMMVL